MHSVRVQAIWLVLLLLSGDCAWSRPISGKVREASAKSATIQTNGGTPAPGDAVEICFLVPDGDDEVSVGKRRVESVEGSNVWSSDIKTNPTPFVRRIRRCSLRSPTGATGSLRPCTLLQR